MTNHQASQTLLDRSAALLGANDTDGLREALLALLKQPSSAASLRALDEAGLLTRIFPELEPARATDQPTVHFLPVLAHLLETVTALEWLLGQIQGAARGSQLTEQEETNGQPGEQTSRGPIHNTQYAIRDPQDAFPIAVRTHPELRYATAYAEELHHHFAENVGERYPRAALFKLAALLHDIAKPQTKQTKPGGGVSFHEHQTIGGEVAARIALRLGFREVEARYIRLVVREHMRPGQLATLDEVTPRAVARFFHATGDAGPDLLLHMLADHMATRGPLINIAAWRAQAAWIDALLDTIWGEAAEVTRPLVSGDDIMRALGIGPGPLVGRLLASIGEAQAGGEITTSEEAIALAKKLVS